MYNKKMGKSVAWLSILIIGLSVFGTTVCVENCQDTSLIEKEVGLDSLAGFGKVVTSNDGRLTERLVIKIYGNALFTDVNGVVSGDGTALNPYVISGWYIDAQGGDACIYLENTTAYFVIRNCTLVNATNNNQWPGGAGIRLRNVRNGVIEYNNLSGNAGEGVHLKGCSNIKIINNTFFRNTGTNLEITNSNNCTILNNVFYEWADGVKFWSEEDIADFSDSIISNNYFYRTGCAISFRYRHRNIITNNTIIENGFGIDLHYSSLNEIYNNSIIGFKNLYSAGQRGIGLFGCSRYNNITFNTILDCDIGIYLWTVGSDWYGYGLGLNIFENNTISWTFDNQIFGNGVGVKIVSGMNNLYMHNKISNMKSGFYLTTYAGECRLNIITENEVISNSECAIKIDALTHDNRIYLNDFIRNGPNYLTQAYDNEPGQPYENAEPNFWNTSTHGNYWLGWTSPDSDLDGIVDFPYLINGDGARKDFYPLAEPVTDDKPSAVFEYPYDGLVVTIPNVQFNGKGFDDIYVQNVKVRINGGEWYNCTLTYDANKPGEVAWNFTLTLTPGLNKVEVMSYDSANQSSDITIITVIYDTQPPNVSITSHSNGQCVNNSMITLEGIASDDIGISKILVRLNNISWEEATGTTNWRHTTYLQNGNNFIEVQAVDAASRTTIISINVSYDLPPNIAIYNPMNGSIINQAQVTVSGNANDDIGIYKVEVRVINNQGTSEWINASGTNYWETVVNLSYG
ncbi:MAG: right-handed parallel beta-helix repeat-containing protein, partial [Thermoplasmata archaeon]